MIQRYFNVILGFSLMLLFGSCREEDTNSLPPSEVYIKYFGSTGTEKVVDMVQTINNEFLILGSTTNTVEGDEDFYLVKTDSAGNGIWEMKYGNKFIPEDDTVLVYANDVPSSIYLYNNEQNALLIGYAEEQDSISLSLYNIDLSTGEQLDSLIYRYLDERPESIPSDVDGFRDTWGSDVVIDESGNVIILGSTNTWNSAPYLSDPLSIYMMSFPLEDDWSTLELNWEELYGLREEDYGIKILQDAEEYYFLGSVKIPSDVKEGFGGEDIVITEFDPTSGGSINSNFYGTARNDVATNMIVSGQFIMVTGTTGNGQNEKAFFLSTPRSLPPISDNQIAVDIPDISDLSKGTQGKDLIKLPSGDVYIVGKVNEYTDADGIFKQDEVLMIRVNTFGDLDEENYRIFGSKDNDQGNAIILRPDGALVIGATMHFGGSATMFSVIKTNEFGLFE
ncbi:MAG: hypothetical protein OCD76_21815 [Reichenbachiella sp.]